MKRRASRLWSLEENVKASEERWHDSLKALSQAAHRKSIHSWGEFIVSYGPRVLFGFRVFLKCVSKKNKKKEKEKKRKKKELTRSMKTEPFREKKKKKKAFKHLKWEWAFVFGSDGDGMSGTQPHGKGLQNLLEGRNPSLAAVWFTEIWSSYTSCNPTNKWAKSGMQGLFIFGKPFVIYFNYWLLNDNLSCLMLLHWYHYRHMLHSAWCSPNCRRSKLVAEPDRVENLVQKWGN